MAKTLSLDEIREYWTTQAETHGQSHEASV